MSSQSGRKKHLVEGEVSEITRSNTGLGLGKVGKGEGFLASLLKVFKNDNKPETSQKKEKRHF